MRRPCATSAARSWTALHDATTLERPAFAAGLIVPEQISSRRKRKGFLRDCVVVSIGPTDDFDVRPLSLFAPSMDLRQRGRSIPIRWPALSGHDRPLLNGARQRRRSHVRDRHAAEHAKFLGLRESWRLSERDDSPFRAELRHPRGPV